MSTHELRPNVRIRQVVAVTVLSLLVPLAACSDEDGSDDPTPTPDATTAPATSEPAGDPAGDSLYFYPPVEGATLTYTNSGVASGTSEVVVDSVTTGTDGDVVTITETVSSGATPVTVERTFTTGPDGSLTISVAAFSAAAAGMEVTAAGDDVTIPPISELEAGATATGETFVEFSGSGFSGRSDVTYTVNGVEFESVTVPAGTVEAYVVEVQLQVTNDAFGSMRGDITYWFLPGFGMVRQVTDLGAFSGTTELSESSVPLT